VQARLLGASAHLHHPGLQPVRVTPVAGDAFCEGAQLARGAQQRHACLVRRRGGSFPPVALGLADIAHHHHRLGYRGPDDARSRRDDCHPERHVGHARNYRSEIPTDAQNLANYGII
jgi:hypothetical protein